MRIRPIAYRIKLSLELNNVNDTFYVSNLKKCLSDDTLSTPLYEIYLNSKLYFVEEHVQIIDQEIKILKPSRIPIVKV